ncbi:hypothetical protein M9H77_28578 [Catharanthus roseus]|uniref:Uncharacterized protein n=1 Tax=Catharanthus roseus TaxID=4058 RepID=A0ACC0AG03_CATRO|nr:hypothetical protein M9H77_28578 [Catharanthus roseus]
MYKNGVSLTTDAVENDGGNQTKEMIEAKQMNGHRVDERSPSNEKSNSSSAREKVEEPERVQVELKETVRTRVAGPDWPGHLLTRSKPTPAEAHYHWVRKKKDWAGKLKKILGEVGPERPTISISNNIFHL